MVVSFRSLVTSAVLGLLLTHSTRVTAQPRGASPPAQESLTQDFDAGQKLFMNRNFAEAITIFRKVYAASQSPNAHLYLARSLRELGKFSEAYEEMAATVREATIRLEKEPRYGPTRDAAASELALLEPRVGKIVIALTAAEADTAEVTIAGQPLTREQMGTSIAVMPGNVTITATTAGKEGIRQEISVRGGESKTVTINLQETKVETAPTSSPTAAPVLVVQPSSGHALRIAGIVIASVGVVGFATFGVGAALSQGKLSTLKEECGGQRCTDPKYSQVIDDGKQWQSISNVGLVVGAAGIAVGGTLIAIDLISSKTKTEPEAPLPSASRRSPLNVGISLGGVTLRGSW